jgi:hypothetical protein
MSGCVHTERKRMILFLFLCLAGVIALVSLVGARYSAQEAGKGGVGLILTGKVGPEDVGLPLYPKSVAYNDENSESKTRHVGLWGAGSGFNVAVLNMEAFASPKKVTKFYRKALGKYGPVIDCSSGVPTPAGSDLTCDEIKPEEGKTILKVGTKEKQHIVAVEPHGQGSVYTLAAVGDWKRDDSAH